MKKENTIICCSMEKGEIFPTHMLKEKMPKKEKRTQKDFTHIRARHFNTH